MVLNYPLLQKCENNQNKKNFEFFFTVRGALKTLLTRKSFGVFCRNRYRQHPQNKKPLRGFSLPLHNSLDSPFAPVSRFQLQLTHAPSMAQSQVVLLRVFILRF